MKYKKLLFLSFFTLSLAACKYNTPKPEESETIQTSSESNIVSSSETIEAKKYIGSDDRVYGNLLPSNKTNTTGNLYTDDQDNIYTFTESGIFQVMIQLPIPFDMNLDASHLRELAGDFMESDAEMLSQLSPSEFVYYSSSIDRNYKVSYSLDSDGGVIAIYVTQDF